MRAAPIFRRWRVPQRLCWRSLLKPVARLTVGGLVPSIRARASWPTRKPRASRAQMPNGCSASFGEQGGGAQSLGGSINLSHYRCKVLSSYSPGFPAYRCKKRRDPNRTATAYWTTAFD